MKKLLWALVALCMLISPASAHAEQADEATAVTVDADTTDETLYRLYDTDQNYLTSRMGTVWTGDELITSDNRLFRVIEVNDQSFTATAEYIGYEPAPDRTAFLPMSARAEDKKLICMYSTHSDESYEPTDGTSSKTENAGIYDVGNALKENLEKMGVTVEYSDETFLPHDSGAYRRSRGTAEEMLKQGPAAILDLHRDGIPDPDEYVEKIEGENATKVRLLVGRSNENADANRAFAKEIKAVADKQYPGLIKDIYIGKGNYNQELFPKSILLEFGTHTISKERAIQSTEYMAEVLHEVLFGATAQAGATKQAESASGGIGIAWVVGIVILGAVVYALIATGSFKGMGQKLARGASEITGGAVGKKPKQDDK